jgi:hypothetical protein
LLTEYALCFKWLLTGAVVSDMMFVQVIEVAAALGD